MPHDAGDAKLEDNPMTNPYDGTGPIQEPEPESHEPDLNLMRYGVLYWFLWVGGACGLGSICFLFYGRFATLSFLATLPVWQWFIVIPLVFAYRQLNRNQVVAGVLSAAFIAFALGCGFCGFMMAASGQ